MSFEEGEMLRRFTPEEFMHGGDNSQHPIPIGNGRNFEQRRQAPNWSTMMDIAVFGASGHTARFIIAELLRRGHVPIAIGRERSRVARAAAVHSSVVETRVASLNSPESLDTALAGTDAVINCAGPFLDTAQPVIEAALRGRLHYFDLTAEQESARSTFALFDAPARERGVVIAPAIGFYGGFADVLATDAMNGWSAAISIDVAIALDSWHPTLGTRRTGQRNTAPRLVLSGGELTPLQPSTPEPWIFPEPFGTQEVVEVPFTETIVIARHLRVANIRNYLNAAPLRDLRDPATPEPSAVDDYGRSDQRFFIDVIVRAADAQRRATAEGRDIYAITAPIVAEAVERVVTCQRSMAGAFALGELVDAAGFLQSLVATGPLVLHKTEGPTSASTSLQ